MDWLARKLYPKARAYERRSRIQLVYLVMILVLIAVAMVGGVLWLLWWRPKG